VAEEGNNIKTEKIEAVEEKMGAPHHDIFSIMQKKLSHVSSNCNPDGKPLCKNTKDNISAYPFHHFCAILRYASKTKKAISFFAAVRKMSPTSLFSTLVLVQAETMAKASNHRRRARQTCAE
jgi:hypothetical protein